MVRSMRGEATASSWLTKGNGGLRGHSRRPDACSQSYATNWHPDSGRSYGRRTPGPSSSPFPPPSPTAKRYLFPCASACKIPKSSPEIGSTLHSRWSNGQLPELLALPGRCAAGWLRIVRPAFGPSPGMSLRRSFSREPSAAYSKAYPPQSVRPGLAGPHHRPVTSHAICRRDIDQPRCCSNTSDATYRFHRVVVVARAALRQRPAQLRHYSQPASDGRGGDSPTWITKRTVSGASSRSSPAHSSGVQCGARTHSPRSGRLNQQAITPDEPLAKCGGAARRPRLGLRRRTRPGCGLFLRCLGRS
jgi:hypothetical protein